MAVVILSDDPNTYRWWDEGPNNGEQVYLYGQGGNDTLFGDLGNDFIFGGANNDRLVGLGGFDSLDGGEGNDTLEGDDSTAYGVADPLLRFPDNEDFTLRADTLDGGPGADALSGDALDIAWYASSVAPGLTGFVIDLLFPGGNTGDAAGDTYGNILNVHGTSRNDTIGGNNLANVLEGDSGADWFSGRLGNDTIHGSFGNDTMYGEGGADFLDGGDGADVASYTNAAAGLVVDMLTPASNTGDAAGDTYSSIEILDGTPFNDGLAANNIDNFVNGWGGNDFLWGRLGNDTLFGGAGQDSLIGEGGADVLDGGTENDWVSYYFASALVFADLLFGGSAGEATGDTYFNVEWLEGSLYNDHLGGDNLANIVSGVNGDDLIAGRDGNDTLQGAIGNDTLIGDLGADRLEGGGGDDWASYSGATTFVFADLLFPGLNANEALGDTYFLIDNVLGSAFDDHIGGDDLPNLIVGQNGNDLLAGRGGNDSITGDIGADIIYGDAGNDSLDGGVNTDALIGGIGDDFYYADTYLDGITENSGEGTDTVFSSDNFILPVNVENLILLGSAYGGLGNDLGNAIAGNESANGLAGGLGNDTLVGYGGADALDGQGGADGMYGHGGTDTYFIDNAGDQAVEAENGGEFDTIWTTVSLILPAYVEILILNGGNIAIDGTGNDGLNSNTPNLMLGNNAANTLTTFGGNDIILGLSGNDSINSGGGSAAGVEIISGGIGNDTLTSGGGHDYFTYANINEAGDTITDFTTAGGANLDILDLRPMFFPTFTNTSGVNTVAQAVASGHLTFTQSGANTQVFADASGGANNNVLLATLLNTTASTVQAVTLI